MNELIDAPRVVADLRELGRLTSDSNGAQRIAWSEVWRRGRVYYESLLQELSLTAERDEAGNLWTYIPGRREGFVAVGSHLDSVPGGGWLDGALGVMAGVGIARSVIATDPELGLALIDFADEEGARFGRSLFGSSAVAGSLRPESVASLCDKDGRSLVDVLAEAGVDLSQAPKAARRRTELVGYLELHIEQGPVLEAGSVDVGVVDGVMGIERLVVRIEGQAGHAGATPMSLRRDALMACAEAANRIEAFAREAGGLATIGELELGPAIATAVPGWVRFTLDLRHRASTHLTSLIDAARGCLDRAAGRRRCGLEVDHLWHSAPTAFDARLIALADDASRKVTGRTVRVTSGPGHDAVEMARRMPAAMMFAPSKRGLSHTRDEDTEPTQLETSLNAFAALVSSVLEMAPGYESPTRAADAGRESERDPRALRTD